MSETTQALEQLFDAGSREGQLLAYRKCLEITRQIQGSEEIDLYDEIDEIQHRIQEQIARLEAKERK